MRHNNYLNQKKVEYFYHQFYPVVFHVACLYTRDIHLAEDITQETFCKALKNMHQLNDQGKIKAWLIRIVTNTASDFLKLKARYLVLEDPAFILPGGKRKAFRGCRHSISMAGKEWFFLDFIYGRMTV